MDDFTRYYKQINGINIRLAKTQNDSNDNTIYIDRVIDSLNIDRALINNLKKQLKDTKLREFYRSNDSIVFIVDGFLDMSWGYFFTKDPAAPCDTTSFSFGQYEINYVSTVNKNWKKVGIDP